MLFIPTSQTIWGDNEKLECDHTKDTIQSMHMMKFQQMPLLLLPTNQYMGGIVEISQIATQISVLLYPMREIDEILIMAKVFANTLAYYLAFLEISQIY